MKTYHKFNFFKYTYCEFNNVAISFFEEKKAHFQSKSGSYYSYTDEGVYRYSNHWGRVANCRWPIKGIEDYKNQNYYVGFAKWTDFYPLNDIDKVFYLLVNFESQQVKIMRVNPEKEENHYLMNSILAHKRLKEIQTIFKEYKWAKYINASIEELRELIIDRLLNSNTSLAVIKQEIKAQFD